MPITDLASSDIAEAMTDRMVKELDPRIHPSTKAFFEHVKPEVADAIADFYNRRNRLVIETAFLLRQTVEHLSRQVDDPALIGVRLEALKRALFDLCDGIHLSGYEDVLPAIGALRGFDDNGIAVTLEINAINLAEEVLNDDSLKALEDRLFPSPT